jgi:peptidoglycan/xylan/chitin deacetylase (PgdA/CDA1 family)
MKPRTAPAALLALALAALVALLAPRPAGAEDGTSTSSPSCRTDVDRGQAGFFRTDPWAKGEVVLTFDDGPHPKHTPRVLDLLAEHRLPATFFVVGRAISRDTYHLVQRIVSEGHLLGSHSYSHDVKMTKLEAPEHTIATIRGQHEVTGILVDLALLATSAEDFDALYLRVFELSPRTWLSGRTITASFERFAERHRALLAERGYAGDARPYPLLYSRPPGGGPYVEYDGAAGAKLHDAALAELGMLNVLWHGASGDTVPEKRGDYAFLTGNMDKQAELGGVLLIHDYIRDDALAHSLARMATTKGVRVVTLDRAVEQKYGCAQTALAEALRGGREAVASPATASGVAQPTKPASSPASSPSVPAL